MNQGKALVLALGLLGTCAPCVLANSSNRDPVIEKMLEASSMVNRDLPRMLDRDTRMDTTIIGPGRKFTYMMTLVNYSSSDIDHVQLKQMLGTSIRNGVCTAEFMRVFIRNNVTIVYRYRANDGGMIGDIVVSPTDCQ